MAAVDQHRRAPQPSLAYLPDKEADDPKGRRLSRTSMRKREGEFVIDGGVADRLRENDAVGKALGRARAEHN